MNESINKPRRVYRRETRYGYSLRVAVEERMRTDIIRIADEHGLGVSTAMREALSLGIPLLEAKLNHDLNKGDISL